MSVSIVPALQTKRQNYVNKKNNARSQITKCERAYESLSNFKTTVSQAQEDFHEINSNAVNDYEDDISLYDRKIAEIDKQIEDARKAEELAKLVLGGGQ